MPWQEQSAMDQRLRFVLACVSGEETMTELCAAYGISRRVGYKWLNRYRAEGVWGLGERSHAPLRHGRSTAPELVEKLVELRRARPSWGARKLVAKLSVLHPQLDWPSHSTAYEILKRAGLVTARRVRRRAPPRPGGLTLPERPNHVWAIDHKGWFRLGDGGRCEPVTLEDSYSRFLLALSTGEGTSAAQTRPVLERAFHDYGLPEVIRSDNGAPFAATGVTGLTKLSAWWIKLGVHPERIKPGRPQENGRLERFHATLEEAIKPASPNRAAQQRRFDAFRRDYNEERPHQALGQIPPASFYTPSPRPVPARLPEPDYPAGRPIRRVHTGGEIRWRGRTPFLSGALVGEPVALEETHNGWRVWFYREPIAFIRHDFAVLPIQPG